MRINLSDFLFHHLQHLVQNMYAPIKHHTAALRLSTAPISRYSTGAVYPGFDAEYISQHTFIINFLHRQEIFIPTAILMNRKKFSVLICCINHLLQIGARQRNRFFGNYIFSRLHCLYRIWLMPVIRHCQQENIHFVVRQNFLKALICFVAVLFCFGCFLSIGIENTVQEDFIKIF